MNQTDLSSYDPVVTPDGWYHRNANNTNERNLLVFIHGFRSDADSCWDKKALESAWTMLGHNWDFWGFQYGSQVWHSGNYNRAASDLHLALAELLREQKYAKIGFVVHSTGGLIVKRLLLNDTIKIQNGTNQSLDLLTRTSGIMNISVPHLGSSKFLYWLAALFAIVLVSPAMVGLHRVLTGDFPHWSIVVTAVAALILILGWTILQITDCLVSITGQKVKNHHLGFHQLAWQLSLGHKGLRKLHDEFTRTTRRETGQRSARSFDFVGSEDGVIAKWFEDPVTSAMVNENQDFVVYRVPHVGLLRLWERLVTGNRWPDREEFESVLSQQMVRIFRLHEQCLETFATGAVSIVPNWLRTQIENHCNIQNEKLRVTELVGDFVPAAQVLQLLKRRDTSLVSQATAARLLRLNVMPRSDRVDNLILLGGPAGCGKSTALREVSAQIANHPFTVNPPLFLPLHRMENSLADLDWRTTLAQQWTKWCRAFDQEHNKKNELENVTNDQLSEFFRNLLEAGTNVFVDGLDDYCGRNLQRSQETQYQVVLAFVRKFKAQFPNSRLVVTLRDGFVPADKLQHDTKCRWIRVGEMSLADAAALAIPDNSEQDRRARWIQRAAKIIESLNTDDEK